MQTNLDNLKVLMPYIRPHFWKILFVLLLIPLGSFTFSIQPILIQKAIDGPLLRANYTELGTLSLFFAVMVLVNFIIQVLQFWLMSEIGQSVVASARYDLFRHLESLSLSFFDRTPVGRSVSRITSDMEQLAESFSGGLILIILDIFNVLGILIFMFLLDRYLALTLSFFLIPVYLLNNRYQNIFRESNLIARKELSKLNSFLQQNIVGISVVHALNSATKSMDKFAKYNQAYFKANDENIKADSQLSAYTELVSLIAIAILILVGIVILKSGSGLITTGILVAFVQYAQSLFEPIRNLSDRFTIVQSAFTSLERINELKSEKIEIKDLSEAEILRYDEIITRQTNKPLIEFRNVWFKYQVIREEEDPGQKQEENWVLKDISFCIERGQRVAFVGKTGCGKSTIIKLLTRLYDPDRGEILINGENIKNFRQAELRKKISVIHQDSYIFAGNLFDNIKLNRNESELDLSIANEILHTTTLDKDQELSERATNISSGEQQVINFARVLVGEPSIVVLDEATAKIDRKTEGALQKILNKFTEKDSQPHKKTLIFIAHRLETIKDSDLIYKIDQGRISEQGTYQELFENKLT